MGRRYRREFSAAGTTELWDRRQRGESLKAIGQVFGKPLSSIYFQLAPYGGIRPAHRWLHVLSIESCTLKRCASTITCALRTRRMGVFLIAPKKEMKVARCG